MSENDRARLLIGAIADDIAQIQREAGGLGAYAQAEDKEAFEIVRRIERRLKGISRIPDEPATQSEAAE